MAGKQERRKHHPARSHDFWRVSNLKYEYKTTSDLLHSSGPTYRLDPDTKPLWWFRNVLRGGRPMRLKTALAQEAEFQRAISEYVRARGGIVDDAVTTLRIPDNLW